MNRPYKGGKSPDCNDRQGREYQTFCQKGGMRIVEECLKKIFQGEQDSKKSPVEGHGLNWEFHSKTQKVV